ncbi:MAG: hypothetical protein QHJ81_10880 [Anaerolineae bacterium]|jgi:hypothetical protein|nr:hypothetical protein [Anaerolineae bacterium]
MSYPQYRLPLRLALSILGDALRGRPRSFRRDASELARGISSRRVFGEVPDLESSPRGWLVTVNHYFRPGFGGWWIGVAVAAAFPVEMHWVMTSAWTYPDGLRSRTITPATRWLFRRLAQMYGFTLMPPMPPRPEEVMERALAVRRVLAFVRAAPMPVVGLAPEGMDPPEGRLMLPPPGVGRFIAHLARQGLTILPVGLFEEEGALCLRFGSPYSLPADLPRSPEARDREVAVRVVEAIAGCLPPALGQGVRSQVSIPQSRL